MSAEHRALSRKLRPTMEFLKEGDNYKCVITAPGHPERVQVFQLDVEIDEVALGQRKVKV